MIKEIFETYLRQADTLPESLQEMVAKEAPGEKLLVYAFCDLDDRKQFAEGWLLLTDGSLVIARRGAESGQAPWKIQREKIEDVEELETFDGISASSLYVVGKGKKLLAVLHFTRRQASSIGNVRFAAEQRRKKIKETNGGAESLARDLDPARDYRETILKHVTEAKATLVTRKMGVMMRLLGYMKPHRKVVAAGVSLATALTILRLLPPYLTRVLVDDVLKPAEKGGGDALFWLWVIVGSLAFIWFFSELLAFLRLRMMAIMGEKVAMELRDDVYSHMQSLSLSFFGSRPTGSLITRVSSDTDRLWDFITFGFIDMAMALIQVIGVAMALLMQDWSLALLVLVPIPLITFLFYWHSQRMQVHFLRIWRKWSAMTAVLSDVIPGMRVVKAFAQEDREVRRFKEKNLAVEQEAELMHKAWTRFWPTVVILMHTCTLIVWIVGAPQVLQNVQSGGAEGMPLGVFLAFIGYMWMFWEPVQQLGMMSRTINKVTTSASRVFEVLDTVPAIRNKPNAVTMPRLEGHVQFENVTFSYDGVRNVLKGITFDVKPGEMIGLVGPSGGGKTTLVNLICRFYDVKDGRVLLDGTDVRDMKVQGMRRQIGVVLQEPYLFHGSIAENIAYGSDTATLDDILMAARAANAHDFICGFADGYDTVVGERGQTLSGGERQRISIARAILHNPRLLILDEATSSVDSETEKKIQEALRRLVAGRTTFAIAHRLSTLNKADRLFVMEEGKLVEQGTHAELVAKTDGLYAKLHKTQMELHAAIAI